MSTTRSGVLVLISGPPIGELMGEITAAPSSAGDWESRRWRARLRGPLEFRHEVGGSRARSASQNELAGASSCRHYPSSGLKAGGRWGRSSIAGLRVGIRAFLQR